MTSTGVGNLEFDTEQGQRSAHVMPKQPPTGERTPPTARSACQKVAPRNENAGPAGFRAVMLCKMADDGRRPKANGEIPD
jgi:hypothetical protein